MSIKLGDRVKLVRLEPDSGNGGTTEYVSKFLGTEGTVTSDYSARVFIYPFEVRFDGSDEQFCFNAGELEVLA